MTWPWSSRAYTAAEYLAERASVRSSGSVVTAESALRHSAVWAARRLRADLVSTMPVDVFRLEGGVPVEKPKPVVFVTPGGDDVDWCEWTYSSQDDLDALGNTVGIITQRNPSDGRPRRVELQPNAAVTMVGRGSVITEYRVYGEKVAPEHVWHERQFTRSGLPVGLSPIANAAMQIGGYLSAQEFARDWFAGGGIPAARLRNTERVIPDPEEAQKIKDRFRATVSTGDLLVTGKDWEYDTIQAKASESAFIDQMQFSITDLCRFMGVPADMIDAEVSTGSITYANVTQRNLQLLILNLNPVLRRREATFSRKLLSAPVQMRFNRGALLEMDLKTRYEAHAIGIGAQFLAPSEARLIEGRAPFTDAQMAEFKSAKQAPQTTGVPA